MSAEVNTKIGNVISEMKNYFGDDSRRINHALAVLGFAREISAVEGGDKLVIECAAALHDIGIHEAERKYNSSAGNYQELEGPPIAEEILKRLGLGDEETAHILKIIANHHSARDIDTLEFRVIWDSDWLVNIPDEYDMNSKEEISKLIEKVFKTETGKNLAYKTLT